MNLLGTAGMRYYSYLNNAPSPPTWYCIQWSNRTETETRINFIITMLYRCLIVLALFFSFSACSIHKIDIQQGNIVDDEQLEKLQLGARKQQVVNLLGTPLVQDPFHPDRWDYLYYLKPANKPAERYQLTLFFEGDYLVSFTTDIPQRRPKQLDNKEAETEGKTIKTP